MYVKRRFFTVIFSDAIPSQTKKPRKKSHHELLPNVSGSGGPLDPDSNPGRTLSLHVLHFASYLLEREAMVLAKDEATALIPKI